MFLVAGAVMALALPTRGEAQTLLGPQLSWGSDSDLGIGGRVMFGLPQVTAGLEGIVSADYFFVDCGEGVDCSWFEINANGAYNLAAESLHPYVGAGLNVTRVSVDLDGFGDGSDTEVGINLLGGLKFPGTSITPFAEARLTVGGGEQFVLTGGILFGGKR